MSEWPGQFTSLMTSTSVLTLSDSGSEQQGSLPSFFVLSSMLASFSGMHFVHASGVQGCLAAIRIATARRSHVSIHRSSRSLADSGHHRGCRGDFRADVSRARRPLGPREADASGCRGATESASSGWTSRSGSMARREQRVARMAFATRSTLRSALFDTQFFNYLGNVFRGILGRPMRPRARKPFST